MRPVVVLSTNESPDYLFLLPIAAKTWELQGFMAYCIVESSEEKEVLKKYGDTEIIFGKSAYQGVSSATISQCIRLYCGSDLNEYAYVILSDADMLIASNFLYRDFDKVNVFGHDLTGFDQIPVCYTGMEAGMWRKIMNTNMKADIEKYADLSTEHGTWVADQSILTAKLKAYGYDKINFIDRGTDPNNQNLPKGRWDRYGNFKKPEGHIHDVHLMRNPMEENNFRKIVEICETIYPKEDWNWLTDYRNEFLKQVNRQNFILSKVDVVKNAGIGKGYKDYLNTPDTY